MRSVAISVLASVGIATAPGCGAKASADPAWGALMRIDGGQYVPGAFPAASPFGPKVQSVELPTNLIWPGYRNKPISGALDPVATAAAFALSGDNGYWVVTAGVPAVATPTFPSFFAKAAFSVRLAPGDYTFETRAIDGNGHFGPPDRRLLTALLTSPSSPAAQGELVITLTWDTESDLDLHVVDAMGNEIYPGAKTTIPYPKPGEEPPEPGAYGRLDVDSNGGCVIDGRRREDVFWPGSPPSGHYVVRVDAASLCDQPTANWVVRATLHGAPVGEAHGIALESDTWGSHDRGAGLTVLQFDVP